MIFAVLLFYFLHCKTESVQNERLRRHFRINQQNTHSENIKLLEVKSEQTYIFLTQSMDLLEKLLQDLRERLPRTSSKRQDRETTLLHKELSK